MTAIAITQVHHNLFGIIKHASQTNERTVISQKGKNVAAIIGPEDMNFLYKLDELEDQVLAEMADESMGEPGENISFEDMKKHFARN